MTELISLLNEIVRDTKLDSFVMDGLATSEQKCREICEIYFQRFKTIYDRVGRHEYSKIAKFARSLKDDQLAELSRKIELIINCAAENEHNSVESTKDCYEKLLKLHDHIDLQIEYLSGIGLVDVMANEISTKQLKAVELVDEAKETVKNAKEETQNLKSQLVSILGIFSGIVVAFSFSITTIGEALSNLKNSKVFYIAFLIFALGIVFINAITLLMVFVAKISGFSLKNKAMWWTYGVVNAILVSLTILFAFLQIH